MGILLLVTWALGCEPMVPDALRTEVEAARDALTNEDEAAFAELRTRILGDVPCLTEPVDPKVWARFLVALAIEGKSQGKDWKPLMISALTADDTVDRLARSPNPIATFVPGQMVEENAGYPWGGATVYVDGRPVTLLPLHGPHLIQARTSEGLRTRYSEDLSREDWSALLPAHGSGSAPVTTTKADPPKASPASRALMWTGGAVALAGGGLGLGSYFRAHGILVEPPPITGPDDTSLRTLTAVNVLGYAVGAAGLGLGVTGVVLLDGSSFVVGPRSIGLSGQF